MKPQVSIIVPVYNAELYLRECLESIRNQTLRNIEIICVNDGSTDNSLEIIKKYALEDRRIKVINKKNEGVVSARKAGIQMAKGKYIGYVDSDDWIELNMYELLYNKAEEFQVDMVSAGYYLEGNYTTIHLDSTQLDIYGIDTIQQLRNNSIYNIDTQEIGLRGALCCKLFRADKMKLVQLQIPNSLIMSEDTVCVFRYLLEADSAFILKKPLYHWRNYLQSSTHINKVNSTYLIEVNEIYKYFVSLYAHVNFSDEMRNQIEIYMVALLANGINRRLGFKNQNLLRIDPYWLDKIPKNARILTYGGSDLLDQYHIQLRQRKDIRLEKDLGFERPSKELLQNCVYDYILITIKNKEKALSIKEEFVALGIEERRLLWFEQPDFYWKYVKAQGMLEE